MPLPPKGDPRRPLYLAIRSTRVLAAIFLLFGSFAVFPLVVGGVMLGGLSAIATASFFVFYMGPGVVYLLCSIYLKRRQFWAVLVSLVLASIQLLLALTGMVFLFVALNQMSRIGNFTFLLWAIIPIALIILALAQLIYHLILSFEAIKYIPIEEQRGFEPILPSSPSQLPP
jgi:hypothetical protein